jgi:hypothetical protein
MIACLIIINGLKIKLNLRFGMVSLMLVENNL